VNLQWEYSSPSLACITLIHQGRFRTRGVDKVIASMEMMNTVHGFFEETGKDVFDSVEETCNEM